MKNLPRPIILGLGAVVMLAFIGCSDVRRPASDIQIIKANYGIGSIRDFPNNTECWRFYITSGYSSGTFGGDSPYIMMSFARPAVESDFIQGVYINFQDSSYQLRHCGLHLWNDVDMAASLAEEDIDNNAPKGHDGPALWIEGRTASGEIVTRSVAAAAGRWRSTEDVQLKVKSLLRLMSEFGAESDRLYWLGAE